PQRLLFFSILTILVFLLACGGRNGEDHSDYILRVGLFDNPTNLDPRTYSDVASFKIIVQVYDFLVRSDSTGSPQPVLAESWEIPSDTVYIFKLHPHVYFHDGYPLTASDVAYTFQSILDPALKAPARKSFEIINKISVLDSLTLKIKLKHPYSPFLSDIQVGIVPRHIVENHPTALQRNPVGSGPFKFISCYTHPLA
ncbi:MAG: ABC transporter substrate-binding protein, partial [Calditrichia bacterium]